MLAQRWANIGQHLPFLLKSPMHWCMVLKYWTWTWSVPPCPPLFWMQRAIMGDNERPLPSSRAASRSTRHHPGFWILMPDECIITPLLWPIVDRRRLPRLLLAFCVPKVTTTKIFYRQISRWKTTETRDSRVHTKRRVITRPAWARDDAAFVGTYTRCLVRSRYLVYFAGQVDSAGWTPRWHGNRLTLNDGRHYTAILCRRTV